ncbi:MAG: hypothetical protein ABJL64_20160 [Rhizobiaceae bacterium]
MKESENLFEGEWQITEMAKWDHKAINLVSQANIIFDDDEMGSLLYVAVRGFMDCRYSQRNGRPLVEFSWQGRDERDETCGRGWASIEEDGSMSGHIYIHCGEDSSFGAVCLAH